MKIHRLYVDKNGESHFEDVEVEVEESTRAGRLSARLPATGIIFREVPPTMTSTGIPPRSDSILSISTRASNSPQATARRAALAQAR